MPERPTLRATKGITFVNVRRYVKERHGDEHWAKVLELLSEADRALATSTDSQAWLDIDAKIRIMRAIDAVCGRGDLSTMDEMGRFEADSDFPRTVRVWMRAFGLGAITKLVSRGWDHLHAFGKVEVEDVNGGADGVIHGWVADEAMCREMRAYLGRILELAGARDVRVRHPECCAKGGSRCLFECRWR